MSHTHTNLSDELAAYLRRVGGSLKIPEGFVTENPVDEGQFSKRKDRLVSATRQLAREGEKAHQVTVIPAKLPSKKDARHGAILAGREEGTECSLGDCFGEACHGRRSVCGQPSTYFTIAHRGGGVTFADR